MTITLRAARINKGYTMAVAAELLGISKDTLSNYERGITYPDVPILRKIEEVYGIKYTDLFF